MTADEIIKIRDGKQRAYENNYSWFQQTGEPSYDRAARRYEQLVDICNQALNAADDHTKAIALNAEIHSLGSRSADILHHYRSGHELNEGEVLQLIRDIRAIAKHYGFIDKWEGM